MTDIRTKNASANKRIARNSIFMSIRMLIVLIISLYTTRAILSALGVVDYGVYNVVCGFVSMFAFLNSSMSSATQRFYNFELGVNSDEGVCKVYYTAVIIHVSLALIILIFTEVVGIWYLNNKLVIPEARADAAFWVFQFSLASLFVNVISVPYSSAIMAYEKMDYYAIIGICDAVLKLLIVFLLYTIDSDRLIVYGILFFLIALFNYAAYRLYAKHCLRGIQFRGRLSKSFFVEMLSFAGWNMFGSFAYMMREQGINLVLNAYFGPVVNAAKGVANQVNGALQGFTSNILTPARPQIVQSYAKGEYDRTFRLMNSVSKLCCLVFLMMSLPVCLEIHIILQVWLGENVPHYTESFIVIMLITNTWGSLIAPVSSVVHATGKMKFYQITSSISNLFSVPLALLFLLYDNNPEYVFYALLITMFTNHLAGLVSLKRLTTFSITQYCRAVIFPLIIVIILSVASTLIPFILIRNDLLKFFVVCIVSTSSILLFSYMICFDSIEKNLIKSALQQIKNKVRW